MRLWHYYGSGLFWRRGAAQGSPLVPADLKMVSASSAAATVIVSDTSRYLTAATHAARLPNLIYPP